MLFLGVYKTKDQGEGLKSRANAVCLFAASSRFVSELYTAAGYPSETLERIHLMLIIHKLFILHAGAEAWN